MMKTVNTAYSNLKGPYGSLQEREEIQLYACLKMSGGSLGESHNSKSG